MHLFLLDENYVTKKRYDNGYLMQYSDNVDMVFVAIDGATEEKPDAVAVYQGVSLGSEGVEATINMDWTSFDWRGTELWGWCCTIPQTFTQLSGAIETNVTITFDDGRTAVTQPLELTVEPSDLPDSWQHSMSYAQWKELVSYFLNSGDVMFPLSEEQLKEILD